MDIEEVEVLLRKYQDGTVTPAERNRLERLYNEVLRERQNRRSLDLPENLDHDMIKSAIYQRLPGPSDGTARRSGARPWLSYAAAALLLAVVGMWWQWTGRDERSDEFIGREWTDVAPGGERATLFLSDGRVVPLDGTKAGIVIDEHTIRYGDGSALDISQSSLWESATLTLATPHGGQYEVTLPDGSQVWLNATSRLTYPREFSSDERRVQVEGEAYFSVRHDPQKPFLVRTSGYTIQVLGTEFNVRAYRPEKVTTTLVSGKVMLSVAAMDSTGQSQPLSPGEQAVLHGENFRITHVDAGDYTAWRDGLLSLPSATLQEVIAEIERWYDVRFLIPDSIDKGRAYILLDRRENLSTLLRAIEQTYQINTTIKGKEVLISE